MTRAALDAYYTPDQVAGRCCRWLSTRIRRPVSIVEPSVGGGAWVRAARRIWPTARIDGCDVDPAAEGLALISEPQVGSWLSHPYGVAATWSLVLGNPPYDEVDGHIFAALHHGETVALLLRETITGGQQRWRDLWRLYPPSRLGKLPDRVSWGGGSSHASPDTVGHVLVVWERGQVSTRWEWIPDDGPGAGGLFGGDR